MTTTSNVSRTLDLRLLARGRADQSARRQAESERQSLACALRAADGYAHMKCKTIDSLVLGARAVLRGNPAPYEIAAAVVMLEMIANHSAFLADHVYQEAKQLGCNSIEEGRDD